MVQKAPSDSNSTTADETTPAAHSPAPSTSPAVESEKSASQDDVKDLGNVEATPTPTPTPTPVVDVTPPSPTGTLTLTGRKTITVSWSPATDNQTGALSYLVYYSVTNNIGSIASAQSNGTPHGAGGIGSNVFQPGISNRKIEGLDLDTTYYFSVVVCDGAGNCGIYPTASKTTVLGMSASSLIVDPTLNMATPKYFGVSEVGRLGTKILMRGYTAETGYELWSLDRISKTTELIHEFAVGTGGGTPRFFAELNGKAYFTLGETDWGRLYSTSGVAGTTAPVVDIYPSGADDVGIIFVWENALYFSATYDGTNYRLYRSDGTAGGTITMLDLGTSTRKIYSFAAGPAGTLFFQLADGNVGKTNGTAIGSSMITTAMTSTLTWQSFSQCLGANCGMGDFKTRFVYDMGRLWFVADDGISGMELWRSDGTLAGTVVYDISAGASSSNPDYLSKSANGLVFTANVVGIDIVHVIDSGYALQSLQLVSGYTYSVGDGTSVYFFYDGVWKTNGTVAGTSRISTDAGLFPIQPIIVSGSLYYWKDDVLYKTNGSPVTSIKSIGGPSEEQRMAVLIDNGTFFWGDFGSGRTFGSGLMTSDGTTEGTYPVGGQLSIKGVDLSKKLAQVLETLTFAANGNLGTELYRSDGFTANLLQEMNPGPGEAGPTLARNDSGIYWSGFDGVYSRLWRFNSSGNDLTNVTPDCELMSNAVLLQSLLYFACQTAAAGNEIWSHVLGTTSSTIFNDLRPGALSGVDSDLGIAGSNIFFSGSTAGDYEIWKSDGTTPNTVLVKNIGSGGVPSLTGSFDTFGNKVVFNCRPTVGVGREPCISDGSSVGTFVIKDLNPGGNWGTWKPRQGITIGSYYVFIGEDVSGPSGLGLFSSTGTLNNIVKLVTFQTDADIPKLVYYNGAVYFTFNDGTNGEEIWRTDGTIGGTGIFKDINVTGSSRPAGLSVQFNKLFFSATDGINGFQMWMSDGTAPGTVVLSDLPNTQDLPQFEIVGANKFRIFAVGPGDLGFFTLHSFEYD